MQGELRGDPGRLSIGEIRAAIDAGRGASAAFVRRLESDSRAGARAAARAIRRRAAEAARADALLELERAHWMRGIRLVAGVDEAGMGPLAGPVVAAAVILPPEGPVPEAEDSKALSAAERERLDGEIRAHAIAVGVGRAEVREIAETDVYQAGLLAMRRAVLALEPRPEVLLVDARTIPGLDMPQEAHVKGDARSRSIGAASIIAKVARDALMAQIARQHPGYGFERHAGYGTPEHLEALRRLGPCAAHRTSWAALAEHGGELSRTFYELRDALRAAADRASLAAWRRDAHRAVAELTPGEARRLEALARRRLHILEARSRPDGAARLPFDD